MRTVAALYVDPRGPYPKMEGVDCWDEKRDARLYDGPHPVVAHPPCGHWGRLKPLHRKADADCGPRAVEQVRAFGGVLEHPEASRLWKHCGLPRPGDGPDASGGFSVAVDQVEWGHVARKRTWLYVARLKTVDVSLFPPFPGAEPTHLVAIDRRKPGWKESGLKECSHELRRRTPKPFAEWLVALARSAS